MPEQEFSATVISKEVITQNFYSIRTGSTTRYYNMIAFEFPDGSNIRLQVKPKDIFDTLQEGDTGMLTYKGNKDSKIIENKLFISFEKDE